MSECEREAEIPWDFWQICRRTKETPQKVFFFYTGQHVDVSSIWAYKMKKFFLLHFVWMLHLRQWNREEIKLLNNRVLNIAGTNNRIRERIKSYPLGFGTFGGSQLLTHSPNKLRSGVSRCWPSEGGSAQQPQLPRWFSPFPPGAVLAEVMLHHRLLQHVRHCQHAREGTGYRGHQKKCTQSETLALFVLMDTLLSELCWGEEQTLRLSHQWGKKVSNHEKGKWWTPEAAEKRNQKAYITWANRPGRNYNLPSANGGICSEDTKVPIPSPGVPFRLREPTKTSLTLQEDENWQKIGYLCIKYGLGT